MSQTLTLATDERASGAPGIRGGEPHYQPQLDGVRGLAILAVLFSHASTIIRVFSTQGFGRQIANLTVPGWGGVDVFFALSGFLITGILLRGRGSKEYFKSFYIRRILRIFPIYYLVLLVTVVMCTQIPAIARSVRASDAHLPVTTLQKASYCFYLQELSLFSGPTSPRERSGYRELIGVLQWKSSFIISGLRWFAMCAEGGCIGSVLPLSPPRRM